MNSKRSDLPPNPAMDEHRELVREAILQYLKDKTTSEERKKIIKEAIDEWLDDKYADVGKWTIAGIGATFAAYTGYMLLVENGWTHK